MRFQTHRMTEATATRATIPPTMAPMTGATGKEAAAGDVTTGAADVGELPIALVMLALAVRETSDVDDDAAVELCDATDVELAFCGLGSSDASRKPKAM